MDGTVVVGVAGVVGTLVGGVVGPFVQVRLSSKSARQARLFDERLVLYAQVMAYVNDASRLLEWNVAQADYRGRPPSRSTSDRPPLTPRIELIAPPAVRQTWRALMDAEINFADQVVEGDVTHDAHDYLFFENDLARTYRQLLKDMQSAVRDDLETGT